MTKKTWDLYAPIYEKAMRMDRKMYEWMYRRISKRLEGKTVLEVATGPGLLAKHVARYSKSMIATDFSEGMIAEAKKGSYPDNLRFEIADVMNLQYADDSFEVVLIANVLHLLSEPEGALKEIDRVLAKDGLLIAPQFTNHNKGIVAKLWSGILRIAGVDFKKQWNEESYVDFLRQNGWKVDYHKVLEARIPLMYVECTRVGE